MERERAAPQHVQGVPTDPFKSRVGTYLDNLRGNAIYHTQLTEGIYSHLGVTQPPSSHLIILIFQHGRSFGIRGMMGKDRVECRDEGMMIDFFFYLVYFVLF